MNQPRVYKDEPELVAWLKKDLDRQRDEDIAEEDLVLYIGSLYKEITVPFNFALRYILGKLGINERDDNNNIVCPYKIYAVSVTFNGEANFRDTTFSEKVNFNGATFSKEANFRDTTFSQDAYFTLSTFSGKANFRETTFSKNANFSWSTFSGEALFLNSAFSSKTNFSNIKFEENEKKDRISIKFDNIKLENNSYMIFDSINYDSFENKFIENKNSKIEIINTVINGRVDFNNVFLSKLNLEGSNIVGILNRINFEFNPINSDTACILKNEELKKNNTIKALKFKAIEKDKYTKELFDKIIEFPKNLGEAIKKVSYFFDYLSILLSKISNNHGQNWWQAVIFTIIVFVGSFAIYYAPYSVSYTILNGEFFSELIKYFVPINYKSLENYVKLEHIPPYIRTCGVIVYMLGKIGTAYGIVQIVQAFRKFNSKG